MLVEIDGRGAALSGDVTAGLTIDAGTLLPGREQRRTERADQTEDTPARP